MKKNVNISLMNLAVRKIVIISYIVQFGTWMSDNFWHSMDLNWHHTFVLEIYFLMEQYKDGWIHTRHSRKQKHTRVSYTFISICVYIYYKWEQGEQSRVCENSQTISITLPDQRYTITTVLCLVNILSMNK